MEEKVAASFLLSSPSSIYAALLLKKRHPCRIWALLWTIEPRSESYFIPLFVLKGRKEKVSGDEEREDERWQVGEAFLRPRDGLN